MNALKDLLALAVIQALYWCWTRLLQYGDQLWVVCKNRLKATKVCFLCRVAGLTHWRWFEARTSGGWRSSSLPEVSVWRLPGHVQLVGQHWVDPEILYISLGFVSDLPGGAGNISGGGTSATMDQMDGWTDGWMVSANNHLIECTFSPQRCSFLYHPPPSAPQGKGTQTERNRSRSESAVTVKTNEGDKWSSCFLFR